MRIFVNVGVCVIQELARTVKCKLPEQSAKDIRDNRLVHILQLI